MLNTVALFRISAPHLFSTWSHHPQEAVKNAIQDVMFALKYAVIDLDQLRGLEKVFAATHTDLLRQPCMPAHRRQTLAWRDVVKEDTYQRILIQLPLYTPREEDEYESEAPEQGVRMAP